MFGKERQGSIIPTCVELARTDWCRDVAAVPVSTVPGVGHQLPARVARDQTAFVGGILLSNIVSTEETLAATAQHSPPRFLKFHQKL